MNITLKRINDNQHFEGINEKGQKLELSGDGNAVGPMESVLMAVAGCSSIDIVSLLEKMRQKLDDIEVKVTSERREEIPRIFIKINMHYILTGDIKEHKAQQVIDMSVEKYCSVSKMLEPNAEITTSFEIITV